MLWYINSITHYINVISCYINKFCRMGVRGLWSILDNVKEDVNIESLKGKTLAVDLSIWIVESIEALKHTNILRPHLR